MKNTTESAGTQKHTPGPWRIQSPRGAFGFEILAGDRLIVQMSPILSTCFQDSGANAHIIAAAPELLDIVKRINWAFYVDGSFKAMKSVMAETKALIAKAEGRN